MDDIIVIGAGPTGAAAAQHSARRGLQTRIIGPSEPQRATHQVWSSHYDEGRLTHRGARNVALALLAHESMQRYRGIEQESGIGFYTPCGTLSLSAAPEDFSYTQVRPALEAALGFTYEDVDRGTLAQRFPMLATDMGYVGLYDAPPAGIINPRRMVAAHLAIAEQHGATRVDDIVTAVTPGDEAVTVSVGAQSYRARRVVVAAGGYSGLLGLLPTAVPHTVKSETVTLAQLDATTAAALGGMPSMMIDVQSPVISDAYLTPPLLYPDGNWYLKIGSNCVDDLFFTDPQEVQTWVRSGGHTSAHAAQIALLRALFPAVAFGAFQSVPCLITRTPSGVPDIGLLHPRVAAMVGCNGSLAKSSDAIGRLLIDALTA
ncbi:MAG: hypothetical protein RLZZ297_1468 [Chloroflexota bacterium]